MTSKYIFSKYRDSNRTSPPLDRRAFLKKAGIGALSLGALLSTKKYWGPAVDKLKSRIADYIEEQNKAKYKKTEVVVTIKDFYTEGKLLINDTSKEGKNKVGFIGEDIRIGEDSTGTLYRYGTFDNSADFRNAIEEGRINVGDTLRLKGTVETSDLEKAAKDRRFIVPVRNASIRYYIEGVPFDRDGTNPLLPPVKHYVP